MDQCYPNGSFSTSEPDWSNMTASAWRFYEIQSYELSSIRTMILIRTLIVDTQPFGELIKSNAIDSTDWELRHGYTFCSKSLG